MINIPKGTKDVLPEESYKWHYVENVIRELTKAYNIFHFYCHNRYILPLNVSFPKAYE